MEIWKDVNGYEGLYQISSYGKLKRFGTNKLIKPIVCTNGYLEFALWKNGKRKVILSHRLVAIHFLENPNNLPEINHLDENITNNNMENLAWCTSKENSNYGNRNNKVRETKRKYFKKIAQYDLQDNLIETHECIESAAKSVHGDPSFISRVAKCEKHRYSAYGYYWEFV